MQVRKSILILLIITACLFSYFNTLFADFVWDDELFFVELPHMKSFSFLPRFFTQDFSRAYQPTAQSHYYRPLLAVTFMLEYALWGESPLGCHFTNILLHIFVCILLLQFVEMLIHNKAIAFMTSLLFAVHPVHTEVVCFISNISYLNAAAFFLLSLILFLQYAQHRRIVFYLLSLVCFSVSLLIMEVCITLPLIALVIDYLFLSRREIKKVTQNFLRLHLGFFIILGVYLIIRSYVIGWSFISQRALWGWNFANGTQPFWRFLTILKVFALYIRLLFFPYDLKIEYFFQPANSLFEPTVFIGLVLIMSLIITVIKNTQRHPVFSFSIIWLFITMLPVSNLLPQGNIFAERYLYIPSIGFCIGIGFLFWWLINQNIKTKLLSWNRYIYILFILLIIAFGRVVNERNKVWQNNLTLWSDTAYKSPQNFRSHLNLSAAYYNLGQLDKALEEIHIALKLAPSSSESLCTLGSIYLKKGLTDKAIYAFEESINNSSLHTKALVSLSAAYYFKGDYQRAIETAIKALKIDPNLNAARYNLAISYAKAGLADEAIKAYEKYLIADPGNYAALVEVGYLYYNKGDYQKAKEYWLEAQEISASSLPAKKALELLEK